jgi:hypothetical protein
MTDMDALGTVASVLTPRGTSPTMPQGICRPWWILYRGRGNGISPYFMLRPTVLIIGLYLLCIKILIITVGTSLWLAWVVTVFATYTALCVLCYIGYVAYRLAGIGCKR